MDSKKYYIATIMVLVVLIAAYFLLGEFRDFRDRVYCRSDAREVDVCTQEFDPVCGFFVPSPILCIEQPCFSVFSNPCHACMEKSVFYFTRGNCTAGSAG